MWERWASNSAKTVRPTFIHHCSASAMQHDFSRHCAFRPFSVQIVFPAKPCYPLEVSGVVGRHKALYRTLVKNYQHQNLLEFNSSQSPHYFVLNDDLWNSAGCVSEAVNQRIEAPDD